MAHNIVVGLHPDFVGDNFTYDFYTMVVGHYSKSDILMYDGNGKCHLVPFTFLQKITGKLQLGMAYSGFYSRERMEFCVVDMMTSEEYESGRSHQPYMSRLIESLNFVKQLSHPNIISPRAWEIFKKQDTKTLIPEEYTVLFRCPADSTETFSSTYIVM